MARLYNSFQLMRAADPKADRDMEFSAKQFFADRPPASTELLPRAAETDPEAASLLSEHPRNVDGAILLVHPLG
jgi:hypothetical protein